MTEQQIKEFEHIFPKQKYADRSEGYYLKADYDVIKAFISDLLAKEKMELVERIEGKMKVLKTKSTDFDGHGAMQGAYDLALNDVLEALKSEIQEKEEVGK